MLSVKNGHCSLIFYFDDWIVCTVGLFQAVNLDVSLSQLFGECNILGKVFFYAITCAKFIVRGHFSALIEYVPVPCH